MPTDDFLRPELRGRRFDGAVIPLDFLRDLGSLDEIIREVAKSRFRDANSERRRVPRGFDENSVLALTGIDEGSAIPVIKLMVSAGLLFNPALTYLEAARDSVVKAIGAVAEGKSPAEFIPVEKLKLFRNFGDRLKDNESIVFATGDPDRPVVYTKEIRRKLLLAASTADEVQEEIEIRGVIVDIDTDKGSFDLRLPGGGRVKGKVTADHRRNLIDALDNGQTGVKLSIRGTGSVDRSGKLIRIETVRESNVLDPLDIVARLDDLRVLKAGWLGDGEGVPLDPAGLSWLDQQVRENYADDLPLPRIFPTPDGHVSFEWLEPGKVASLEIDLSSKVGEWLSLNMATKANDSIDLNLDRPDEWQEFGRRLSRLGLGVSV